MIERETTGLDFGALRHAIVGRELDLVLGFYSEDAEVRVVNADAPFSPPFELVGQGGDRQVPARRLRTTDDSPSRGDLPRRRAGVLPRGVRVPPTAATTREASLAARSDTFSRRSSRPSS